MSRLEWDKIGEHYYETGTDRGVVYPMADNKYGTGAAWNGLTGVSENRSGADETKLYANNGKYLGLRAVEDFGGTITAYTAPDEFLECDGQVEVVPGVTIGQQPRKPFGMTYRTKIGNDTAGDSFGYKLHLVYGATASPSSRDYKTINDSPEAIEFSWEFSTTPVNVEGHQPTAEIEIDSRNVTADQLKQLEDLLYGTESAEPTLPLPAQVFQIFQKAA